MYWKAFAKTLGVVNNVKEKLLFPDNHFLGFSFFVISLSFPYLSMASIFWSSQTKFIRMWSAIRCN